MPPDEVPILMAWQRPSISNSTTIPVVGFRHASVYRTSCVLSAFIRMFKGMASGGRRVCTAINVTILDPGCAALWYEFPFAPVSLEVFSPRNMPLLLRANSQ